MNTPAHAILNILLQGRQQSPGMLCAIAFGAVLPDLSMIMFYTWHKLIVGTPEMQIWHKYYPLPQWQAVFDGFHSIPLSVSIAGIAWLANQRLLAAMCLSMTLHCLFDLPVHHDDGHRHFFPLSDWRYSSPVSYWHPDHHGRTFGIFESALVTSGGVYLFWHFKNKPSRWLICIIMAIYFAFLLFAFITWVIPNA